jgi:hypothetical protein
MTIIDWVILISAILVVTTFILVRLFGKNKKTQCGGNCSCCSACKSCAIIKNTEQNEDGTFVKNNLL